MNSKFRTIKNLLFALITFVIGYILVRDILTRLLK